MDKKVRVRYAPSPTGYLHIGGARSALFNYLYAKKHKGDFVFRIEDTDIERNIEGAEYSQLHDLLWLNIIPDESIENPNPKYKYYRQMEKLDIYKKYAQQLLDMGAAYECFCSEEDLEKSRLEQEARGITAFKYDRRCLNLTNEEKEELRKKGIKPSIRLKVPDDEVIEFEDLVRGKVTFNSNDFGDFVIMKSNGIPTYNFAVVIDDHIMDITHVFRGEEHLSNTPKQLFIYKYFNWEPPKFGHMTIIVNEKGKKLSKRDNDIVQFVSQYRKMGFIPEAIDNFLLLLGWTPDSSKEIYSLNEMFEIFDEKRLSKSPSMFDNKKLYWMNSQYIKMMDDDKYFEFIKPFLITNEHLKNKDDEFLRKIALIFKSEISYGEEINKFINEIYVSNDLNEDEIKYLKDERFKILFDEFYKKINSCEQLNFTKETFKPFVNELINQVHLKGKDFYMPLRLALTGYEHGVEMYNILNILGKDEVLKRISEVRSK